MEKGLTYMIATIEWLIANPILGGAVLVVIAMVLVIVIKQGRFVKIGPVVIGESTQGETLPRSVRDIAIFENSDNADFSKLFEDLFRKADRIVMIGTGFNILQRDPLRKLLAERIQEKCHIEIYAANPFSPNVQTRLIEEETSDIKPKIRKAGLLGWLSELLLIRDKLDDKSKFILRLFPFYPTYALFVFNGQDYFYYPYGYAQLGTLSPVTHYSAKNPSHKVMIQFLDLQHKQISQRSSDANLVYSLHKGDDKKPELSQLAAFAVYIVPSATSALYEWGSKILEYDVREKNGLPTAKWHKCVGAASEFGLHITIADALYCATEADVNLIGKEVEFLAHEFRPFTLNLTLEKDFPNERGISLVCQDKTGSLEALHYEMVSRVYRKAIASNYSLGLAHADRDSDRERTNLMIEHYHAPYILQRFTPHFSLLSAVPAEKKEQVYQEINDYLTRHKVEMSIEIRTIAVMNRPTQTGHWQIRKENGKDCEYPLIGG
jgi:uncharacterized protein DUF1045